jgi:hypothetical protein
MDQLARELAQQSDPAVKTLTDAVDLSRRLNVGSAMHQTAEDLSANRVGQALTRETEIAAKLEQLLNLLRNEQEQRPQQLAEGLREAEKRLAELQQQLAGLLQQTVQSEQRPAAGNQPQLAEQQQQLQREIERLARELDRLQASDAGKSTQSAANRLGNQAPKNNPRPAQRPAPSRDMQQAENDLKRAADQLVARREQAEDDLALEFVRRFQSELGEMVQRQKRVLEKTADLDRERQATSTLEPPQLETVTSLGNEERQLADKAKEHSELLFGLGSVRLSLEEAERRLEVAGALLDQHQTGRAAQRAEQLALARLEGMLRAFAQTARQADPKQNPAPPPPPAAQNNQPQRRPTFELLEVKMLRMLQADLNARTQEYHERVAALTGPVDAAENAAIQQEARDIAAEQGRLAELVRTMLLRDNEKQQE